MKKWSWRLALSISAIGPAVGVAACSGGSSDSGPPALTNPTPADRLQKETGTAWAVDVDPASGTPDLVLALDPIPATVVDGNYEQAARDFLEKHKDMWRLTDVSKQLALEEIVLSGDNTAHVRFAQVESGLKVDARFLAVHFRDDGSIGLVNGVIAPDAKSAVASPALTPHQATRAAEALVTADYAGYQRAWLDDAPIPSLILVPNGAGANLAYTVQLAATGQHGAPEEFNRIVHVDAQNGAILNQWDLVEELTGTGTGVLGDTKTVNITQESRWIFWGGDYELVQAGGFFGYAGTPISTFDYNNGSLKLVTSPDKDKWETGVKVGPGSAIDGHKYISLSDQYYRDYHGWRSYNGWGGSIRVIVHENTKDNRDNAFWDGNDAMHFSDGDTYQGGNVKPLAAGLDVTGHEFTHGVTQSTSGLKYSAQSGALNESLSDIFGTFIEDVNSAPAKNLDLLGDASFPGGIRSMAHPSLKGQPDNMSGIQYGGQAPVKGNDWGGVHTNSGIPNNAWWLMTFGGTNDTSKIPVNKSLGTAASRDLWWKTQRNGLGSGSQFDQLARWQTAMAKTSGNPIEAVGCAWVATGVLTEKYVEDTYKVKCYCALPDGGVQQPSDMKCCDPGKTDQCCKQCDDAGDGGVDAGPGDAGGGKKTNPDLFDSCKGRADGVYCSQLASYSSIKCRDQTIVAGLQCANKAKCLGPNGPGETVQCEGQAPPPPSGGSSGMNPPPTEGCSGRSDGIYCSVQTPNFAYVCKGGSIAGGQLCSNSNQKCTGPNGAGTAITCQ